MAQCNKTLAIILINICLVCFTFGNSVMGGSVGESEDADESTELIILGTTKEDMGKCNTGGTGGGIVACQFWRNPSNLTNEILNYVTWTLSTNSTAVARYSRLVFMMHMNAGDVSPSTLAQLIRMIEEFLSAKENERWRGFTYFVVAFIEHEPTTPWLTETNLSPVTVATNLYFWSEARWELTEVYSIHGHVITNRMDDVHNFNTMMNHIVFKTRRRSNFDRAFIAVITEGEVFDERIGTFKAEPDDQEAGIFTNSITYLQHGLNFSTQPVKSEGIIAAGPNGTLLGSAGQLNSNAGDINVDEWEVIEYRVKGPDGLTFLVPFDTARMLAYFKQPGLGFKVSMYVHPFASSVWIMLAVTWTCVGAAIYMIACGFANSTVKIDPDEILIWVTGSISMQGWFPFQGTAVGIRIISIVASLTALIVYIAYSALLVSMFSIEAQPVKKFDDIVSRGEEQFHVAADSMTPTSRRVIKALESEKKIKPVINFTERLVDATKEESYNAIVNSGLVLVTTSSWFTPSVSTFYPASFVCEHISKVPIPVVAPIKVAFTVRKWSPFREYFDYKLLSSRERGVMHAWTRRRFVHVEIICETRIRLQSTDVSLPDSLLAFAVVGLGACLSIMVFVVEKIVFLMLYR